MLCILSLLFFTELDLTIFTIRASSALLLFIRVSSGALAARCKSVWIASEERYTEHGGRDSQAVGPKTAFHWYLSLTQPPTVRIHGSAAKRAKEREREREKDRPTYITIIQHTHKNLEDLNAAGSGRR